MQKHVGGVQGTVLGRGYCPVCRRGVAGGYSDRDRRRIWLRPHKSDPRHPGSPWCRGGGDVVPVDRALMDAWGKRRRNAERARRERWRAAASVPAGEGDPE